MDLSDFLAQLVKEKAWSTDLPPETIQRMVADLSARLDKYIALAVMTELSSKNPALMTTFQSLAQGSADPAAIGEFIAKEIPDSSAFIAKVLADFRALYIT